MEFKIFCDIPLPVCQVLALQPGRGWDGRGGGLPRPLHHPLHHPLLHLSSRLEEQLVGLPCSDTTYQYETTRW